MPAWDSLSESEKTLYTRQMEVYAGYQENADHNIGRLVAAIEEMGILDDTLVFYIFGDNGSSMEGTTTGSFNEMTVLNGVPLTAEQQLSIASAYGGAATWGGATSAPHFSCAWAWAGNTPFQWGKQVASHFGGTRDPMVVRYPKLISDRGGLRSQFTHVNDVVPTILEIANIPAPKTVNGIEQIPMHGVSFAYTFDDAKAPDRHTQQYFEILGNRAMYKDGWMAEPANSTAFRGRLDPKALEKFTPGVWDPEKDVWKLYNVAVDFSQANDLAQQNPQKLAELKALFWSEAEKYNVTPLLGGMASFFGFLPPNAGKQTKFVYYPGVQNVGPGMIPHIYGSSYTIEADLVIPEGGAEGAIVANADSLGGFSLYVQGGKLHHTYDFLGIPSTEQKPHPKLLEFLEHIGATNAIMHGIAKGWTISSPERLPSGPVVARFEFVADEAKVATGGKTRLLVNGKPVAEGRLEHTVPLRFSGYACMDIGRDNRAPVSPTYKSPFVFTGTIKTVTFDIEPTPKTDAEKAGLNKVRLKRECSPA